MKIKVETRWLWLLSSLIAFVILFALSSEIRESVGGKPEFLQRLDESVLATFVSVRSKALNSAFTNVTALGSAVVLTLLTLFATALLIFKRNFLAVFCILASAIGSAVITGALKNYFERSRPPLEFRLVDVGGFSYPSGHSVSSACIYFSMALILSSYFKARVERFFLHAFFATIIIFVCVSRLYLGVHYVSDVVAGVFTGLSWACLVFASRAYFDRDKSN